MFDEEVRDNLLEVYYNNEVTSLTRKLLRERGQPMRVDAERLYKVLIFGVKRQEMDTPIYLPSSLHENGL